MNVGVDSILILVVLRWVVNLNIITMDQGNRLLSILSIYRAYQKQKKGES